MVPTPLQEQYQIQCYFVKEYIGRYLSCQYTLPCLSGLILQRIDFRYLYFFEVIFFSIENYQASQKIKKLSHFRGNFKSVGKKMYERRDTVQERLRGVALHRISLTFVQRNRFGLVRRQHIRAKS